MVVRHEWQAIGTVVGNASTYEFTFILKSFSSRVGDLVAVRMEIPNDDYAGRLEVHVWGRITSIDRFNPFFPHEAAQELAGESLALLDTVLSDSRDHLQATALILGSTDASDFDASSLAPLTYPVSPAATVLHPPSDAVKSLLVGGRVDQVGLAIGTLLSRADVPVEISADRVVARHLAILAMTGGGKTVAARRILKELIALRYPILIFDPHGDYVGLWQAKQKGAAVLADCDVRLFYPHIAMTEDNQSIVETLIAKMTVGLTEPQKEYISNLLQRRPVRTKGVPVLEYIRDLIKQTAQDFGKRPNGAGDSTIGAVRRSLSLVERRLAQMETTNERLRDILKNRLTFEQLPDPEGRPEGIVRPGQVSILYLSGYDHLTQSTIVSIVMEALFGHRASLSNRIAPFLSVIEEAHNFIPSAREGADDTPSLTTLRKVITEGRKFGTGLMLITQRPSRVDETILAQCNSFLVLRLVNPKDQSYVRSVMENLSDTDAKMLPGFGPGQGLVSGQAVRFPLLVRIKFDEDLVSDAIGDESFLQQAEAWRPDRKAKDREIGSAAAGIARLGRRLKGIAKGRRS